jgi:hypothetical protein
LCPPILARQQPVKNVTAATNTYKTIEEFYAYFYAVHVVSRELGDYFFPELLVKFVRLTLGPH